VSDFKGIPIVPATETKPRSGDKYRTPQGFTAIKDGIKVAAAAEPLTVGRKPQWLRAPMPAGKAFDAVRATVREHRLATVCEEAKRPNIGECWNAGNGDFMLMGRCTRACRFCAVDTGNPRGWLDTEEPQQRTHRAAHGAQVRRKDSNRDDLRTAAPVISRRACARSASQSSRRRSPHARFPGRWLTSRRWSAVA
jgi:lipoic acid synthetase